MSGCRTCGLMGVDLRITGDPAELQELTKLPGVKSAISHPLGKVNGGRGGHPRRRPDLHSPLALAATYEGDDPILLERIVPLVDTIEISPDAIACSEAKRARLRPEILDEYAAVLPQVNLIVHGVGLSIGSFDRWNDDYLRLLDELFSRFSSSGTASTWHAPWWPARTSARCSRCLATKRPCNSSAARSRYPTALPRTVPAGTRNQFAARYARTVHARWLSQRDHSTNGLRVAPRRVQPRMRRL